MKSETPIPHRLKALIIDGWPLAIITLLLSIVLVRTAWVCDDAFISFTASANLIEGKGFTFQPDERVQAFSNPLWTLIMAGAYAFTREVWITGMVLGIGLSLLAFWLLLPGGKENRLRAGMLGGLVLLSASCIDFSTSGLENPLSHVLTLIFAGQFLRERKDAVWLRNLSFLAGLLLLNRPDLLFLVAPAGLYALWTADRQGKWKALLLGLLPILLWESFSLVYYGFLLPNTWYAKLGVGEGRWFLFQRGLIYLWDTLHDDPVTVLVMLGGLLAALYSKNTKMRLLIAGSLLYALAVIAAGGDFMRGRMFTVPFVLSLYVLLRSPLPRWWPAPAAVALAIGLFVPDSPLRSGSDYHIGRTEKPWELYLNGITDERAMYWARTGWLARHGQAEHPMRTLQREAKANRAPDKWKDPPTQTKIIGSIGMAGYRTQPGTHLLDEASLAEPLLARLPALDTRWWRAGHRPRAVPRGYQEKLIDTGHYLEDDMLDYYVEKLQLVTRGPVWSGARWNAIQGFLTGRYRKWIDVEGYRKGIVDVEVPPEGISGAYIAPGHWRPLRVVWRETIHPKLIWVRAKSGGQLWVEFQREGIKTGELVLTLDPVTAEGAVPGYTIPVPKAVREEGIEALVLQGEIYYGDFVLEELRWVEEK